MNAREQNTIMLLLLQQQPNGKNKLDSSHGKMLVANALNRTKRRTDWRFGVNEHSYSVVIIWFDISKQSHTMKRDMNTFSCVQYAAHFRFVSLSIVWLSILHDTCVIFSFIVWCCHESAAHMKTKSIIFQPKWQKKGAKSIRLLLENAFKLSVY